MPFSTITLYPRKRVCADFTKDADCQMGPNIVSCTVKNDEEQTQRQNDAERKQRCLIVDSCQCIDHLTDEHRPAYFSEHLAADPEPEKGKRNGMTAPMSPGKGEHVT